MRKVLHFIGGKSAPSASGETFMDTNPATGACIAEVASGGARDVDAAVCAAWKAYERTWSRMSGPERGRLLYRLAQTLTDAASELARIETFDVGKPIRNTTGEIPMGIEMFHYYAGQCDRLREVLHYSEPDLLAFRLREPFGVAGLITAWNYPFVITCVKASAALAAGNCVVIKPSKDTPLSADLFAQLCAKAGLPDGVVNVVHGPGSVAGQALAEHPHVPKISFTGSTQTGQSILRAGAQCIKSVTVELGGKMANIVFEDANLEQALRGSLFTAYINTGQICTSGSRLLVHKSIEKQFVEALVRLAGRLRVGLPQHRTTHLGPMISKEQYEKVQSYVSLAQQSAEPVFVGKLPPGLPKKGLFIPPHIFRVTDPNARIAQEEIFGPVLSVIPFENEQEAVRIANGTLFGLSAAFWTSDLSRAHRMARSLKAGVVWGNTVHLLPPDMPYGGIKQSGLGAESGIEGMLDFMTAKSVIIATGGRVPSLL